MKSSLLLINLWHYGIYNTAISLFHYPQNLSASHFSFSKLNFLKINYHDYLLEFTLKNLNTFLFHYAPLKLTNQKSPKLPNQASVYSMDELGLNNIA